MILVPRHAPHPSRTVGAPRGRKQSTTPLTGATILFLSIAASVLFALYGCSNSAEPTEAPVDVQDLLRRSGEATAQLDTFHFRLEHNEHGSTPFSGILDLTEVEGDIVSPDSMSVEFSGTFAGSFAVNLSLIATSDTAYMTNPLTGDWTKVPDEVSPVGFFDPQRGVEAMMTSLKDPALASNTPTEFIINGDLDAQALEPLFDSTQPGTIRVEVTLDKDTLFLKRAVLDGRVTAGEPDGVVRTITLSRFNEPISISPPDTG